ncbi:MAG: hypothetical protein M1815_003808 [Lichina confinis]|nr:MAG: hypothetical protein M1815_003808 [Lichina confinis]
MAELLPGSRALVGALVAQLSNICRHEQASAAWDRSSNALDGVVAEDKQLFVTLHCIFPNDLLPALDLLDRSHVTRFDCDGGAALYYVRSTQTSRSRGQRGGGVAAAPHHHEVRLTAWNCSCPAFALAAFGRVSQRNDRLVQSPHEEDIHRACHPPSSTFGGCTRGDDVPPVCKHVLACFLAERCREFFRSYVDSNVVPQGEMAAWAAGWGD